MVELGLQRGCLTLQWRLLHPHMWLSLPLVTTGDWEGLLALKRASLRMRQTLH